jgi:hypothetical protein
MFETLRHGAAAAAAIGLAVLGGCAAPPAPPAVAVAVPHGRGFTLDTPVHIIAADPRGKAVLDRDLPGLMASTSYLMFDDMSLSQIATVSGGRLTMEKLDVVQADLAQIPASAKVEP